jgi:hypothetical protein
MITGKQFVTVVKDIVRITTPPVVNDMAHVLVKNGKKAHILRSLCIDDWYGHFASCLQARVSTHHTTGSDIWTRPISVVAYVSDLAIAMRDSREFMQLLIDRYKFKFKLKSTTTSYQFGYSNSGTEGTLCHKHSQCTVALLASEEHGTKVPIILPHVLAKYTVALLASEEHGTKVPVILPHVLAILPPTGRNKNVYPVLDESKPSDVVELVQQFHPIVVLGFHQEWAISLFKVLVVTTTIRTFPRCRSLLQMEHSARGTCTLPTVVYLPPKLGDAGIQNRIHEPDDSFLHAIMYDWTIPVYGELQVLLPSDIPVMYRFPGTTTTQYVDATPIGWSSKHQSTVETSTYESEFLLVLPVNQSMTEDSYFMTASTGMVWSPMYQPAAVKSKVQTLQIEPVINLRSILRYIDVPIHGASWMFGNNVVADKSVAQPHAESHRGHIALLPHQTCEAIAVRNVGSSHTPRGNNPADIYSRYWRYKQLWQLLCTILVWQANTLDIGTYGCPGVDDDNG